MIIVSIGWLLVALALIGIEIYLTIELFPCPIWHWQRGTLAERAWMVVKAILVTGLIFVTTGCAVMMAMVIIRLI